MEEEISRTVGAVKTQGKPFDFVEKYDNDTDNQSLYYTRIQSQGFITSIKV